MNEIAIAFLAGFVGLIGYGLSDFSVAFALDDRHLFKHLIVVSLFVNLFGALTVWVVYFLTNSQPASLEDKDLFIIVIFAALNLVGNLMFFKALQIGELSVVSPAFATYPVGVTLISVLYFNESLSLLAIAGIVVVIIGIIAISISGTTNLHKTKGLKQALFAACIFALFFPFWDEMIGQTGSVIYMVAMLDSIITVLFGVVYIVTQKATPTKRMIRFSAYAGFATAAAGLGLSWGFERTTYTSIVVIISSAIGLLTLPLGIKYGGEKPNRVQVMGVFSTVVGMAITYLAM